MRGAVGETTPTKSRSTWCERTSAIQRRSCPAAITRRRCWRRSWLSMVSHSRGARVTAVTIATFRRNNGRPKRQDGARRRAGRRWASVPSLALPRAFDPTFEAGCKPVSHHAFRDAPIGLRGLWLARREPKAARARRPFAGSTHVLVACMAKSGSTFLTDVIAELPGFRRALLVPAQGRRAQELDEACLQAVDRCDYVAQNHVPYSDWTGELCAEYGVAPVVLVRDLLDVVVSLRDHLRQQGPVSPIFFAEPHHASLDDDALALMIVRLALPWYLNFYMSWRQAPDALLVD